MKTLIRNATVLTMDKEMHIYSPGYVLTVDETIKELGYESAALPDADEVIDAGGGIVLPGFINTHCHVPMMPFRSLGDDCPDRLRRFLFPLENEAMTKKLVKLSSRYGISEMLLAGVTAFTDMYYYEEEVAKACEELGIRGVLGETVIGQKTCDSEEPYGGLGLAEAFIKEWKGHELALLS